MPAPSADRIAAVANDVRAIWPDADADALANRFIDAIGGDQPVAAPNERWTERDTVLITYGDSIRGNKRPLQHLTELVASELSDAFGVVHVLPFAPSSSDRGFAVLDYTKVDPGLGIWDDFAELGTHADMMFDLVVNHISAQSVWFEHFLRDEKPGDQYFITVEPGTDLSDVVRPRSLPLLTTFDTPSGSKQVWTTFSDDQVDLDWSNPDLVCAMLEIIDLFVRKGARFLRLDAIAYLWKEIGTDCVHRPETHSMVRLIHSLLAGRAPNVALLTETNVPDAENRSYFGGGREAHLIYNFTLPPLLIDGLIHGRAERLVDWLTTAEPPPPGTTMMNFMSSHDGIGVRPAEGFLTDDEIAELAQLAHERGGMHGTYDRAGVPMPYEINVSLPDLFGGPGDPLMVSRILLAHTVVLSLAGVAAVYINSLMATTNDLAAVEADGVRRSINRGPVQMADVPLVDDGTWQHSIFAGIRDLAAARRTHAAFHPDGAQGVSHDGPVLRVVRTAPDGSEQIEVLCNFSDTPTTVAISGDRHDLLNNDNHHNEITLAPYGTAWLQ